MHRDTGNKAKSIMLLLLLCALVTVQPLLCQSSKAKGTPAPPAKPLTAVPSGSVFLTLSGSDVTDAKLRQILASNPNLRQLKLIDIPNVTDSGLAEIGRAKNLEVLQIVRANFRGTGLAVLAGLTRLQELDLESTPLTDVSLKEIRPLKLKHLSLRDTQVTDNGAWYIKFVPTLEYIDLSNTRISDRTIKVLKELPKIRFLYLLNTTVTDSVADLMAGLTALEVLDLRQTMITDRTVGKLAVLPKLKQFFIGTATVTDDALVGLKGNKTIESLNLCDSMVTDSGFHVLSTLSNLKHVEVYRSHVSSFGVEKLKRVKPGITVAGP